MDELFATNTGPPATAGDGAFERFLTAAIAAIITIMFSWRLLATEENLVGGEGPTVGAVGGAVGGDVPKVVMKKAIKMAKAAGYTEESKALEKEKGLCDEGKEERDDSASGVNIVTSSDPDTEPLITCWEKSSSLGDSEEMYLERSEFDSGDLNQGINGFSRGRPEYRDILTDDNYETYDGEMQFADDIQPRELDSDEEMYCATMLETILEEDSDDMCSTSTGSDVDSVGRIGEWGYFDLNVEGEDEGDYTPEGGCTVHVIDDGSELVSSVITVSPKSSQPEQTRDEGDLQDDSIANEYFADDSEDAHKETAQLPCDLADDSNSDGSDESVITVVTRQISSEKDSPVSANEFSFSNTGQIEIVPVRTRTTDHLSHDIAPITVQSTFQALQPDEPYPSEDQHSPTADRGITGFNNGIETKLPTGNPDIPRQSFDSGIYSVGTRVDNDNISTLQDTSGNVKESLDKFDINSNVDNIKESSAKETIPSASIGNSGNKLDIRYETDEQKNELDGESQASERKLDILFDKSSDVPDYKDAYVSSAVEKTPKGFIFSRFELETTDYQEKLYTTDRPTHTIVAKLVAEEKFVPTEQTDSEIREKFSDLGDGAKLKTSPEKFSKAGSKETDIDADFASQTLRIVPENVTQMKTLLPVEGKETETNRDEQSGVIKRIYPVGQTTAPPEKYLRMDKTGGLKSHRIVPVKKELSVANRLMQIDTSKLRDLPKGDPMGLSKRILSLNQGESSPEKILKIGAPGTVSDELGSFTSKPDQDGAATGLQIATESHETLIDDPSTFQSKLVINLKQGSDKQVKTRSVGARETNVDALETNTFDHNQRQRQNTPTAPQSGHREIMIDSVMIPTESSRKSSSDPGYSLSGGNKETLIDDAFIPSPEQPALQRSTERKGKETAIDDITFTMTGDGNEKSDKVPAERVGGSRETFIGDVSIPRGKPERSQLDYTKRRSDSPKETLIDDVLLPSMNADGRKSEKAPKQVVGGARETLIDDVMLSEPSPNQSVITEGAGKILQIQMSGMKETLIDDVSEVMKISSTESGPRETIVDDQPGKILKINTKSRETLIDDVDNLSQIPAQSGKIFPKETETVLETNFDEMPQRLLNVNRENIQRFRDRASLNRDGSCDDSTGNELDKSFGDVTNRSEEILDAAETRVDSDKSANTDDNDEEEWIVDEVVQEFTLKTDIDGVTTLIPGKIEHRVIETSPEHKASPLATPKISPVHSSKPSPEERQDKDLSRNEVQTLDDRPTPKPRRSLKSDDVSEPTPASREPQRSPRTNVHISPDGKLHLDAIDEVSWKPLSDSETAEKPAPAVKKFVMDDVIISGSHLIPHPRRQVKSEADKSNPLVVMETGDIGSYGTRADLAHLSSDLEAEVDIDFETFSGGVSIPLDADHVTRPLSESSPKQELPDVVDGDESPDESGFPSMEVRRTILEEFKRSKSVEHLRRMSWGTEEESVFMPRSPEKSPELKESQVIKPSPVVSPPIIPDSPVVAPPPRAFLVSKKGSKSVPNLAGIDDSPSIHAPMTHTVQSRVTSKSPSKRLPPTSQSEASSVSRKPSRYTKKSATMASAPVVQASPVIKAAAKTRVTDIQQTSHSVVQTSIDDIGDRTMSRGKSHETNIDDVPNATVSRGKSRETNIDDVPDTTMSRGKSRETNIDDVPDTALSRGKSRVTNIDDVPDAAVPRGKSRVTNIDDVPDAAVLRGKSRVTNIDDVPDAAVPPGQSRVTNIDDVPDAAVSRGKSRATNIDDVLDTEISQVGAKPSAAPTERKHKTETSFGAEIESSPVISPPPATLSASPVVSPPSSQQLAKSDVKTQESLKVGHNLPVLITSSVSKANTIEASPTVSLPPTINKPSSSAPKTRDTTSASNLVSPLTETVPVSPVVKTSEKMDVSPAITKPQQVAPTSAIPESPSIKLSQTVDASPVIPSSSAIQNSPVISVSPVIQQSTVIPTSPVIQESQIVPESPTIPASPSVSIPSSPTVNLDDSSFEEQSSFRGQKRYKSLKEIKRKYSAKNLKSMQMPPTPNIGHFVVPAKAILTARHRINASRKRFLSEENLISENRLSDQFQEHKDSFANTTKYKSPRRPDHKRPSSSSSQDSLETFALMYPNFFLDESSEYRPSIDELHKNCIFTPEGRKDIMNKTLSIENLTLDLGAHLKRFGSVTSLVETDIDTGETSETQPFPETDLDLWFSLQQPIDRAVSMTDLRSEISHRSGKGRFAQRNVPKSKSLQTLETNLDDEEDDLKRTPSVHELRITKSLSKLNIPDWFKTSNLSKSGSCILRHGSTSTMSSWGFSPSVTSSPCPSVAPSGNVVIKTRVSPTSSMRFLKSPKFYSVPTLPKTPEERFMPKTPVKLPSEKLRKEEKPKGLEKIPIVPFAQIRAMFEAKAANQRAGKKESVRQDSVTSKTSERSAVPLPVLTLSSSESPSEIVQLEGSPKIPRSPPVKPPSDFGTKFTTVPAKRTVSPLQSVPHPQTAFSPTGSTSPLRPLSPTDSASPQRPLSPTDSSSPKRPLSPAGSASPQRPQSPAESTSPRSLSPLGSLNSSAEGSRSFSPSDKMRPINPDGPHNRSISPAGSLSAPRTISPGGKLSSRGLNSSGGYSSPERPSSPESPVERPVVKPGPRSILGPTVRFEERETLEIKDNKPPQKPGKKTDFFKRLQVFQRSSGSEKDKDKKQKAEDSSKDSQKQVPASKLKSAFEPFTRKDQASSMSIESAPTIQPPTSAPKSPTNQDPGSKFIEEAPVVRAPNSKQIGSVPSYPTYKDLPETQPIDASYRVMSAPVTRYTRDNLTNDRNSHPHEDTRREVKQESRASPVRVGNTGQSLPTPVLTATPFSRNSTSEASKRNMKETTV